MDKTFQKLLQTDIDLSSLGVERRTDNEPYFCTPKGASVFGWTGVDGIHFCFVRGFGGMVFAVSPANTFPNYVHPLAKNFADFLRLLLACGDVAALEQAWMWDKAQFETFLQDNPPTQEQQETLAESKRARTDNGNVVKSLEESKPEQYRINEETGKQEETEAYQQWQEQYTKFNALYHIAEQSVSSEQARQAKMEAIRDYIQENYADSGLCLAKICDEFQMNQSYLSRTFKEIFGIGILDFIHSQRLLHAKALLKDSTNQIDMIWEAVGYTNRRTFNRSFRKLENMSASEYRKSVSTSH